MPKRNAFLSAVDRRANQIVADSRHVHTQMCKGAAFLAANAVFNMGPSRAPEFSKAFDEALKEIALLAVKDGKDDKELWKTKDTVDKEMERICGENFVPWDERYR